MQTYPPLGVIGTGVLDTFLELGVDDQPARGADDLVDVHEGHRAPTVLVELREDLSQLGDLPLAQLLVLLARHGCLAQGAPFPSFFLLLSLDALRLFIDDDGSAKLRKKNRDYALFGASDEGQCC